MFDLKSLIFNLKSFFARHPWAGALLVFSISLLFSRWFWPTLTFPDPDTFYHIYLAEQMPHLVRAFTWLPFTSLAHAYADHHFLYHALIAPILFILGPFVGMQLATIIFAALAHTIFYTTLRTARVRVPLAWTLLLFTASAFEFRMHLAKAPSLSLVFILLGVICLIKKKPIALVILSFFFVWAHGSWPLLPALVLVWCAADFLSGHSERSEESLAHASPGAFAQGLSLHSRIMELCNALTPFLASIIGSFLGLVINPYFPKNISFYLHQIIEIAVVNFGTVISVGEEWYPPGSGDFLTPHAPLFLIGVIVIVAFVLHARAVSRGNEPLDRPAVQSSIKYIALATVIAAMTMKARRHLDYFAPLFILAVSSLATLTWPTLMKLPRYVRIVIQKSIRIKKIPLVYFLALPLAVMAIKIGMITVNGLSAHRGAMQAGYPPDQMAGMGRWLTDHAPVGSIVFNTEWDNFPFLMYQASNQRYIIGLDPTFLYRNDPERYKLWSTLIRGEYAGDVIEPLQKKFNARYIAITLPPRFELFEHQVSLSHRAREVYRDKTVALFEITN